MSDDTERSVGSAGSRREPVAWAVMLPDGDRIYDVYAIEEEAKAIDAVVTGNHGIVPLYRSPTLTDAERDDITIWLAECLRQCSATTGLENGDVAERWRHRALRAGHILTRFN